LEPTQFHSGKVVIVGAGPGDPELLTLKALRHLAKADIVLADRLANPDILQSFAPQAVVIPVGKQCRKDKSTPQATINELLVHHAKAGRYVVRLKGGDISIFSNILDELEALDAHDIEFELVPGVTAALGTAAYAGIPLTARGLSKGVRFITYYNAEAIAPGDWNNLAQTTDTLVFYMSGDTCFELAAQLMLHGKPGTTPIFLAEQATTPLQQFKLSSLQQCQQDWQQHTFLSPAMLIIGEVAALHEKYAWLQSTENAREFFDPIRFIPAAPAAPAIPTTITIS
jgi:uroporphyrin-III C-methyltransferase/precorrin-2 dehydrogenase/sirohydrochlorin ferrochelatase/uroporphyrin-III C-methyltransferase